MTENPRRGVRLPWLSDQEETVMELPRTGNGAEADQADTAMTSKKDAAARATADAEPATAAAEPATAPAAVEPSEPFMDDLVQAMRQITEQARDEAMAQLRASASNRSAELRTATEVRATELRTLADTAVEQVGDWEKGEMERIGAEAAAKVDARRMKLDSQLKANTASGEGAISAVQARIEAFEREMSAFFAQLNDLHDPVAFASAVKRMPRTPTLSETQAAPSDHTAPAPAGTSTLAAKLAPVDVASPVVEPAAAEPTSAESASVSSAPEAEATPAESAATPTADAEPKAGNAEPWPGEPEVTAQEVPVVDAPLDAPLDAPSETSGEPEGEEATTQVLVTGLTSFGAITSFKQSLERVAGIRRVSMGLGTSGEFIFTAAHGVGFDVAQAIRSFESSAQFVATDDQLRVTVGAKD